MARQGKNKPTRKTVALVGDGQTERIYFGDVRDADRPANLSIFPDYPRRFGNYKGVLDRAVSLKGEGFNHVYALIDMDKIIQENKIDEYKQAKTKATAAGVTVLENNPCFEVWLLLHFVHTGRLFSNCNDVVAELRKHIPNYDKGEKFLTAATLYRRYKEQLVQVAVVNARRLEDNKAGQDILFPKAETYKFFEWYFKQQGINI